ncbi:H(+)-transporting V0 sector ATPase subunit a [Quaeritorhiza haematococci]|nr:H(+)-transporting V0 sector ATPase subunit a [Quaeritorhiza haematococci]
MGSLFRSEEMSLVQLYIPLEISQQTVAEIGEVGLVQFRDLNPDVNAFQRAFVNEIRRIEELERKLRFLRSQIQKADIPIKPLTVGVSYARSRSQQEIDELDAQLTEIESRVVQMNTSQETLNKRYLELTELRHVLRETATFFEVAESRSDELMAGATREDTHLLGAGARTETDDEVERAEAGGAPRAVNLGFVAGVIPRARMGTFERILFRALRGNLYMNFAEIDEPITDPVTDEVVAKNVFIIFAHGKEILAKIRKICESLGATLYPVDQSATKRREDALEVIARIEDLKHVLDNTRNTRRVELSKVAQNIEIWSTIAKKEKSIYYIMNMFNYDVNRKALIAEGWCPTNSISSIQYALRGVTERTGSTIPPILYELRTTKEPPTFQRTNKFTVGFQEIIDSYGIATYREVNPGLFTVITFPFLFAVMFGDFGHGLLVTAAAAYMVISEKKMASQKLGEIVSMFFGGRYIILLMGIFSMYTGLIYNDVFSKPVALFKSGYKFELDELKGKYIGSRTHTYLFGVDPAWRMAENTLLFTNSYKMKMSIIFGVMQMTFGIALTVFNYLHFKKKSDIYTMFVPQILFFLSIFGYLTILILYKWSTDWRGLQKDAPGLLNTLIYMFLKPGTVEAKDQLFPGQAPLQAFLVLLALVCVPWMLLAKPYLLYRDYHRHRAAGYEVMNERPSMDTNPDGSVQSPGASVSTSAASGSAGTASGGHHEMTHEEHFEFGEIMIHQLIHTIEFCLGAISNTASYLRLWALSLAHAQLSEVLWEMILGSIFEMKGAALYIGLILGFAFWFSLTVGILCLMEGLSAFLHALRLHWVEFNSKFYGGTGYKFLPFSFAQIMADEE